MNVANQYLQSKFKKEFQIVDSFKFITTYNDLLNWELFIPKVQQSHLANVLRNQHIFEYVDQSTDTIGIGFLAEMEKPCVIKVEEFARIIIQASIFSDKLKVIENLNHWKQKEPIVILRKAKLCGIFANKSFGNKCGIDIIPDSKRTLEQLLYFDYFFKKWSSLSKNQ